MQTVLEVIKIVVQFPCLSSYRNNFYGNDFASEWLNSLTSLWREWGLCSCGRFVTLKLNASQTVMFKCFAVHHFGKNYYQWLSCLWVFLVNSGSLGKVPVFPHDFSGYSYTVYKSFCFPLPINSTTCHDLSVVLFDSVTFVWLRVWLVLDWLIHCLNDWLTTAKHVRWRSLVLHVHCFTFKWETTV